MRMAKAHITALPKNALSRPPSCIGGGVFMVNRLRLIPAMPLATSVHRIQTRNSRPNTAVAQDTAMATTLTTRRRR